MKDPFLIILLLMVAGFIVGVCLGPMKIDKDKHGPDDYDPWSA